MERRPVKVKIGIAIAVLLFSALLTWRFYPRSFTDIIPEDVSSALQIGAAGSVGDVINGQPVMNGYSFSVSRDDQKIFAEIIELLSDTRYRPDFQNLLPWKADNMSSGSMRSVIVMFTFSAEDAFSLSFIGDGLVGLGSKEGYSVYHMPDDTTLNKLVDMLQRYGETG